MLIMTQKGLGWRMLRDNFKIGAQAGIIRRNPRLRR